MLTINVIGKNCNVKIDDTLYTIVVDDTFNLKKLQDLAIKYYYNLNESKNYFNEAGEHNTAEKRASFKNTANSYKERIKKMIFEELERRKKVKEKAVFEKKLEKRKLKEEEYKLKQVTIQKKKIFSKFTDLEVKGDNVYLKGLDFILPATFLEVLLKAENPKPYINFMYNLSSNPNEDVRNKIFSWVHSKGFKITENGYIYAVRWVVKKNDISELIQFVHSEYTKKKIQKKSPKNYSVHHGLTYTIIENSKIDKLKSYFPDAEIVGNLYDLFHSKKDLEFTDQHTKTFTIKLGEVVSINRKDCDESNAQCSAGLHMTTIQDVFNINFGNQIIGCLVNPKDIVSMPRDSYRKFRCCEYYPLNLLDESGIEELKNSDLVIDDTDYELINIQKVFEDLSGKKDLYKITDSKEKLKQIKKKLQSYKVKPTEVEKYTYSNRLIKL